MDSLPRPGRLYLIGAGPGDPELLTLKAVRLLERSDVVLYDRLVNPEILSHAPSAAERIYVGKLEGEQEGVQNRIFDLILEHALAGKTVARLKGGDPLIFGRGGEEWALALDHGIRVEFVPGISSSLAGPGLAGIPLTFRKVSQGFAVVTGHNATSEDWHHYAQVDTLVVLMGVKGRETIAQSLIEAGRPIADPIAVVENSSCGNQRVITSTLQAMAAGQVEAHSPAIIVIGPVVDRRIIQP